tara:strand:+ start:4183 stop:5163 length:981 start_codon:yes stop_codon:yes gene_type:complete
MKAMVITTINEQSKTSIPSLYNSDYNIIIVGDKKTPPDSYENLDYIPVETTKYSDISELIGYNKYSRKNLGYIHSINKQASSILDTDDDNYMTDDIYKWKDVNLKTINEPSIPNILQEFSSEHIWSRGYPLELVNTTDKIIYSKTTTINTSDVGVVQSLVNGDPDVDAIFRMTSNSYNDNLKFKQNIGIICDRGVYSQMNTQSTLWIEPEIFHLLYIPSTVSFRFTDILKGYVAQRCMWEYGYHLVITSPYFTQKRNIHNNMEDFVSEIPMYKNILNILTNILPNIKLYGDVYDIIRVYECLETYKIVDQHELHILKSFLEYINIK